MKVAKPTDEFNSIVKGLKNFLIAPTNAIEKAKFDYADKGQTLYVEIEHKDYKDADSLHKAGFHDWVRVNKHEITEPFGANYKRYEAFVQGYLWYFEQNDSVTGNEDRTIYFAWHPDLEHDLIIYMKPLYVRNYKYEGEMSKFPFPNPPSTVDPPKLPKAPPPTAT